MIDQLIDRIVHITPSEIVGMVAFLTNVAGNLLLVSKTVWGWVVRLVSISLWFAYAWDTADLPLVLNAITFFCINCFGIWRWTRDRKRQKLEAEQPST